MAEHYHHLARLAGVFTMTRWHFDDTNTWIGEAGQLPLLADNLAGIPSWSSNAVRIDSVEPAWLAYLPNADELANGFRIGSDEDGSNQAGGAFDELETFASPLNFGIAPAETCWLGVPDYQADPNGTLRDWLLAYFGHLGVEPYGDYDNDGTNNWQEFLTGADPNKISFFFSVPNQYVTNHLVDGTIAILGGVPSSIAVLVDGSTATNWTAYMSSNVTVDIGTTPGAHDVRIGLRGRLSTSCQTWEETTLILNSTQPMIAITSPAESSTFNALRVNVSGNFTAGTLKQITVNGITAFVDGTSFEARNVPLAGGANNITAVIEDLTGMTNAVSITVTGITNADGSLNDPVQLVATPVAGFAPLTVVFQITSNGLNWAFAEGFGASTNITSAHLVIP